MAENTFNSANPPSEQDIQDFLNSRTQTPRSYKRNLQDRIFVNRDLRLDRIKWVGFDMDYTLAQYNSPEYESLSYDLIVKRLVDIGYPPKIKELKYDPKFPVRGIFFDRILGHLIKIDAFGNIVMCLHGRTRLNKKEVSDLYPSMTIPSQDIEKRYWPLPTLFNLPEACLYADLIDFFYKKNNSEISLRASRDDVDIDSSKLSIMNLFQDVRAAMDFVHLGGELKARTLEDMNKYIKKTPNSAVLLDRLHKSGIKTFLLTNSDYSYTNNVMSYLLDGNTNPEYTSWRDYFDVIIVSAGKPTFFAQGTTLREVNIQTGHLKVTKTDRFVKGHVYQGGSIALFDSLTGIRGNQVLYVGDHIYADIIKSKKIHAWRNMLIIPELHHELKVWQKNSDLITKLKNLEFMKAEVFKNLNSECTTPPDITVLRKHLKQTVEDLDQSFNKHFGSLFSSGSKNSHFSMQVQRYADLYSYDYLNLLNYPLFYHFTAQYNTLPHQQYTD